MNNTFLQIRDELLYLSGIKKVHPQNEYHKNHSKDVLLIHGLSGNWRDMGKIADYLYEKEYNVHFADFLGKNMNNLDYSENAIGEYIQGNNLNNLLIVAHSKGGLISHRLLQNERVSAKINKVITLNTPYKGSLWANIVFRELGTRRLKENHYKDDRIVNIHSKRDELVIPNKNLQLETGENIMLDIIGHNNILYADETLGELNKHILSNPYHKTP